MRSLLSLAALLFALSAHGQQEFEFWPEADYDPAVPTIKSVLGHSPGERITWHRDAVRYFEALAAADPERVSVHRYAVSWERRDLIYVVITSAENMARIDAIKEDMQQLRNAGSTAPADAARIVEAARSHLVSRRDRRVVRQHAALRLVDGVPALLVVFRVIAPIAERDRAERADHLGVDDDALAHAVHLLVL